MSDYFLNKIYDSLLVNKTPKTKSTFRTLAESYNLVYEQELETPEIQQQTNPSVTNNQQTIPEQPKQEIFDKNNLPSDFNVNGRIYPRKSWTPFQQQLFSGESAKTGTGAGETSVANVITNIEDVNILERMVSGQGESYDVAWPPLVKGFSKYNLTFKFEVKELEAPNEKQPGIDLKDTVSIGVEGREFATSVLTEVERRAVVILEELQDLSDDEQKIINAQIVQKTRTPFKKPSAVDKKGNPRNLESKTYQSELAAYERQTAISENWSLRRYLETIIASAKKGEIPLTVILGRKWDRTEAEPRLKDFRAEKGELFFISFRRLLTTINELKQQVVTVPQTQTAEPRIGSLKDVFYKNYKPNETEASADTVEKVTDYLDKRAVTVDKELSKLKAKNTNYKFTTNDFYKSIDTIDTLQWLEQIEEKIYTPTTILSFFPKDLTGFFSVSSKGYIYIPRNEIPNFITLDTFSRGGAKVRFKK